MDAHDYQTLRQLFDDYIQMYSSRDDRLTTHFSEDFSGITGSGDFLVKDREEWVAITRQDFAQVKELRIELKDLTIQSLAETIAVATSAFIIHLPIKDHVLSRKTARLVLIFRKEPAGWKISHSSISIPFGLAGHGEVYPLKELEERNLYLEELVVERTSQLSEANNALQRSNEELAGEIAERKLAEERLQESETHYRLLTEGVSDVVWRQDRDNRFTYISPADERLRGFRADEVIGRHVFELLTEEGKATITEQLRQRDEAEQRGVKTGPATFEVQQVCRDGGLVWTEILSTPERDSSGTITGYHGISRDITERKRAEEALQESEYRWKFAVEGSGDGVWDWDIPTDQSLYSRRWKEMLGYAEDDILPTNQEWVVRVHPDDQLYVAGAMQAYLDGRTEIYDVEYRLRCKDNNYKWILARGMVVSRSKEGKPVRMIGTHTDITGRREHENEQLKIQKLESLGALAGGIAHDFNNILTGIMGNISFAQMFLDAGHKSFKPLVEAEKASVRATELAHQLLTFARGGEPIKKVVSLRQLVNETVSLVLRGSNVKGVIEIPDSIHAIEADEGQMNQVFHNIIINATQAMPGGGTLTVAGRNEKLGSPNVMNLPGGNYVRLSFTDQGCGISDGDLKRIFDPYFTTKSSGTGLGLASVHSIVSRHGGHIGVSSVSGSGTAFTIHLPSTGEAYGIYRPAPSTQSAGEHAGGSILIMDDEEIIREMTTEILGFLGYQATACEDGAEAVARYKAAQESGTPITAVIMDLTIPGGMGGKEAAEQILAIDPAACLIVSSGYSNDPIMSDYASYGFSGAIAKPYNMTEFEQLLSSMLSVR